MIPDVSIVLSCYKRGRLVRKTLESIRAQEGVNMEIIVVEDGDDGNTETAARNFGARYYRKPRTDQPAFQNPSRIHNIGIRRATGKVVLLQGGEVKFETKPYGLRDLVAPVLENDCVATTPIVQSLDKEGKFLEWLSAPKDCPRAGWIINFCLAVDRNKLMAIGGFEESYTGYGFEDDHLMFSLNRTGVKAQYVPEVLASHQWHERTNYDFENPEGKQKLEAFIEFITRTKISPYANLGSDWGRIF